MTELSELPESLQDEARTVAAGFMGNAEGIMVVQGRHNMSDTDRKSQEED